MQVGDKIVVQSDVDVFPLSKVGNARNKKVILEDHYGNIYRSVEEMECAMGYTHQRLWKMKMYRSYMLRRIFHAVSLVDGTVLDMTLMDMAKKLYVSYTTIKCAARRGNAMNGEWIIESTNNYEKERLS